MIIIATITRFYLFGYPSQVVFDEVHFGKFILAYLEKKSFFDIHPPVAKLLIAGFAKIFQLKTNCTFESIGQACEQKTFYLLRFLPSLLSLLFILVFYLFLSRMTRSKTIGLLSAFFLIFENAFIVQGRFILLDIFLLFFGFLTLFLILKSQEKNSNFWVFLAGLSLGCTVGTKWTGLSFLVPSFLLLFLRGKESIEEKIEKFLILLASGLFVYLFAFWVHFQLIPNQTEQALFVGNDFENLGFFQKILRINMVMETSQKSLNQTTHPFQSTPFEWPFMKQAIFYWVEGNKKIFLTGNPVLWYLSTFSLLVLIASFFSVKIKRFFGYSNFLIILFFLSFLANYLPFFLFDRPIFLYHYLPAYAFLLGHLALLTNKLRESYKNLFLLFLFLVIAGFLKNFLITFGI